MECREATEQLAAYVDYPMGARSAVAGPPSIPSARALESHLLTCANCRHELIRYQELKEGLAALATRTVQPPAWLTAVLMDTVRRRSAHRVRLGHLPIPQELTAPRVAAAGGALLLAGLAAGALVVGRGRRRRRILVSALRPAAA